MIRERDGSVSEDQQWSESLNKPDRKRSKKKIDWADLIPHGEWSTYREVLEDINKRGLRFGLGGGLAFSEYSPRSRNTKDVDLFILKRDLDAYKEVLADHGFEDYFEVEEYDRSWIYRGHKDGTILDLIWTMPNHRFDTEEWWFDEGVDIEVHGLNLHLLPVEAMVQTKLFVMQHDRCDWPDILNILSTEGENMDWDRLIKNIEPDTRLLGALLNLFAWLCPLEALKLPQGIWRRMSLRAPGPEAVHCENRAFLLDTRDWFGPVKGER